MLNTIQSDFPICSRPFGALGERLGTTESEALDRVRRLVESGIIRKLGPTFDTRKLGHVSTLVAAKVPAERLDEVAGIISTFPQVTHNYSRRFEYNLWFTLVCGDAEQLDRTLAEIRSRTGVEDMQSLPAERQFKVKVEFDF